MPGAHSDIGGSYARHGLALRSCNLMLDYCNALRDKPFLNAYPEPTEPHLNVVHRSEEGKLIFRLGPKADRLQPEGINLRQEPTPFTPELATGTLKITSATAGAFAVLVDAARTGARASDLLQQDNTPGALSQVEHFGARTTGGLAGATLGAQWFGAAGIESGPFDVIVAGVGGIFGAMGGETLMDLHDQQRIYTQSDAQGRRWQLDPQQPQQGWTRTVVDTFAERGLSSTHIETASPTLAERLTFQATNAAAELALARVPTPRDPYTQPAGPNDTPSHGYAPWTRDAQTQQWSRVVKGAVMEHGLQSTYTDVATPPRAAELNAAAQRDIVENLANALRSIAANYQAVYAQQGWQHQGPMPEAVTHALTTPDNTLQASDGHTYTRGTDGQWSTPGTLWGHNTATNPLRAELDATLTVASGHTPAPVMERLAEAPDLMAARAQAARNGGDVDIQPALDARLSEAQRAKVIEAPQASEIKPFTITPSADRRDAPSLSLAESGAATVGALDIHAPVPSALDASAQTVAEQQRLHTQLAEQRARDQAQQDTQHTAERERQRQDANIQKEAQAKEAEQRETLAREQNTQRETEQRDIRQRETEQREAQQHETKTPHAGEPRQADAMSPHDTATPATATPAVSTLSIAQSTGVAEHAPHHWLRRHLRRQRRTPRRPVRRPQPRCTSRRR